MNPVRMILFMIVFFTYAQITVAQGPPVDDPAWLADVDACVSTTLESQGAPGGALALGFDGEIVLERQYGIKNLYTQEPVTATTLFRPGSVQKMMTSAAVLVQVQNGLVELGDSVHGTVPEAGFAGPWDTAAITVEDLLTHRSGIPDISPFSCTESLSQWAGQLADIPLFAPAGMFFNYTNAGYSMAGLVAERAAGRSFREVMAQDVWAPAGMTATFQTAAEAMAYGDVSWGHEIDPDTGEFVAFPPDTFQCPWAEPSGDFFTTAADLARFPLMLMDFGGDVLDPELAERLSSPVVPTHDDPAEAYGYGVSTREIDGEPVRYHSGAVPGGSSNLVWLPERALVISVVANRAVDMQPATNCVLEATVGMQWPAPAGPTSPRKWRKFRGLYWLRTFDGEAFPFVVWTRNQELKVAGINPLTSQPDRWTAMPVGRDLFWVDLDHDGEANGLEVLSFVIAANPEGRGRSVWLRNRLYVGERLFPFSPVDGAAADAVVSRAWAAMVEAH